MSNKLLYLVIHGSATRANQNITPQDIIRWHTLPRAQGGRGWDRPGYRTFIDRQAVAHKLREANMNDVVEPWEITYGVAGINQNSHHVCMAGGLGASGKFENNYTPDQFAKLKEVVDFYLQHLPDIKIAGHYQFYNKDRKACPSFDVKKWCKSIGLNDWNIYQPDPYNYALHFERAEKNKQ